MAAVLVVDDDGDLRVLLVELLQSTSRPVFAAKDGRAALDLLDWGAVPKPCLVLLDWTGTGGDKFLEQLRTRIYAPDVRVILASGGDTGVGGDFPSVVGFLQKPFNIEVLVAMLDGHG
jgi:DNA-binding response OmpR family regulator